MLAAASTLSVASEDPQPTDGPRRLLLKVGGLASVGLGLLGAFLPLLPTTPFVLLAAFCFARSSPKLNTWLHEHDVLGPPLRTWKEHRAVPPRAKWLGIGLLWITLPATIYLASSPIVRGILATVLFVASVLLGLLDTRDPPTSPDSRHRTVEEGGASTRP